jgi:hypothetical protein
VTAPTAQTLRDHLPRLLADAGWTRRGRHAFRRADRILSLDRNRIFLTEVDLPEGPIIVLEAHVTSVEQAVAYLRIAEVLPAVADSGWRADPPCILCGQPAARGLRHCPSCQDVLGHTAPLTEVLPGGDR